MESAGKYWTSNCAKVLAAFYVATIVFWTENILFNMLRRKRGRAKVDSNCN